MSADNTWFVTFVDIDVGDSKVRFFTVMHFTGEWTDEAVNQNLRETRHWHPDLGSALIEAHKKNSNHPAEHGVYCDHRIFKDA